MGYSALSIAAVVLIGSVKILQSLVASLQENHHGDTGPDYDAGEHGMMDKLQETHVYTETKRGADPPVVVVRVLLVLCGPMTFIRM